MKRWAKGLMVAACCAAFSVPAAADTIVGLYSGTGLWFAGPGGSVGDTAADVDALGLSSDGNAFFYVALEHPIPTLPNVRLQHTRLGSSGEGVLSGPFRLDDVEFSEGETVSTELDLTHNDVVMYYELLDNVVTLDVGLTLRMFSGHARAAGRGGSVRESVGIDLAVPMAYGRALVELPASLTVGATAHVIGYSGNSLQDLSAHIAYAFDTAVDVGVELGYRQFCVEAR